MADEDRTLKKDIRNLMTGAGAPAANFVVLAGPDIGRKYEIAKMCFTVGRDEDCDICIEDEDVSRRHAQVEVQAGIFVIRDLGSMNGTLINGQRVDEYQLHDGDRVQVGSFTILKFNFLDQLEDSFNEQLYNSANKDYLTQIYNKKFFFDRLKSEFSYSRRHEVPLSLIILDLDHFKKINDTHGHTAGDHILRELAIHLCGVKRQEDLFARYGGEEFVLLLRGTPKDTAIQIADKLRLRIQNLDFVFEEHSIPVTISVGVTTYTRNNYKTYDTFFRAADMQLLRAKKAGRNRISFPKEGLGEGPKNDSGPSS